LLAALLLMMTFAVFRTALLQWREEVASEACLGMSLPSNDGMVIVATATPAQSSATQPRLWQQVPTLAMRSEQMHGAVIKLEDTVIAGWMLFIVVLSGTVYFHTQRCVDELRSGAVLATSCKHPFMEMLFHGRMQSWMKNRRIAFFVQSLAATLPIWSCSMTAFYYASRVSKQACWTPYRIVLFQVTAFFTGWLAGMVGIGGGLILSPFFLITGIDPAIAVGTSSTCVFFTSASTTLQYLLTDRIIVSLAVVYGFVALAASYAGTVLVHLLRSWFPTRKSYISFLVALTVAISVALVMVKFVAIWDAVIENSGDNGGKATRSAFKLIVEKLWGSERPA